MTQFQTNYYDETCSEDMPTDEYSDMDDICPAPVASPRCHQRKAQNNMNTFYRQANAMARPPTSTQLAQDRRVFPAPVSRVAPAATPHRVSQQPARTPTSRHAPEYHGPPAPEMHHHARNAAPHQPAPRPKSANPERFWTQTGSRNEPACIPLRFDPTLQGTTPPNRRVTSHSGPQQHQQQQQRLPSSLSKPRPSTAHQPHFEESHTSNAAKSIALNYKTSSDLTMDQNIGDAYATYTVGSNTTTGHATGKESKAEMVSKSSSQNKCNVHLDQCGDGNENIELSCKTIDQAVGLEKSKKMIVSLIDSAIEQLRIKETASKQSLLRNIDGVSVSTSTEEDGKRSVAKELKKECIRKLEEELSRLKVLENFIP